MLPRKLSRRHLCGRHRLQTLTVRTTFLLSLPSIAAAGRHRAKPKRVTTAAEGRGLVWDALVRGGAISNLATTAADGVSWLVGVVGRR